MVDGGITETALSGVVWIGGGTLISLVVLLIVRRAVPLSLLEMHHEVTGFIFGVIGVIYAVIIAFSILVVWEKYDNARVIVSREANQISDLYQMANGLTPAMVVKKELVNYTKSVLDKEWPHMEAGTASLHPWRSVKRLWNVYNGINPDTPKENAIYAESLKGLADLSNCSELRWEASQSKEPKIIWVLLLIGGVITIAFTYFFKMKSISLQSLMTAGLSVLIGLMLFVYHVLGNPYGAGSESVKRRPFEDLEKSFLMLEADSGDVEIVKTLTNANAEVNDHDDEGKTALMLAVYSGNTEKVTVLIDAKADVNAKDTNGFTALMPAAESGNIETVKVLIDAKADVNAKDNYGYTALIHAAWNGDTETVEFLIEHEADVNAKDNNGKTALMWAIESGNAETVEFLIEHKADVNAKDNNGKTALMWASEKGHTGIVDLLKSAGAKVNH